MSSAAEDSPHGEPGTFRRMVETLPLFLYADRPGDLTSFSYVSPQVEAMLGYSPEQSREDSFFTRILHPDDREQALAERQDTLVNGSRSASFAYRIVDARGHSLWVRDEAVVVTGGRTGPSISRAS